MEMREYGIEFFCPEQFKIDLIVWKWDKFFRKIFMCNKFKIDLIVWK